MTFETPESTPPTSRHEPPVVDLTRAILPQVAALGEEYWDWVHEPVTPKRLAELHKNATGRWASSLRIFESNWLESQSHIPWWLVLLVWVPVTGALLGVPIGVFDLAISTALGLAAFGFLLWTLTEYTLHRCLFHYRVRSALGRRIHFLAHGIHHLDPWDGTRLVFPPVAGILIALVIFGLFRLALPTAPAMAAMSGVIVGYIAYDMIHYYTHHGRPRTAVGKFLRRYHLAHHHQQPHRLFGVSSPLWDLVFRTGN